MFEMGASVVLLHERVCYLLRPVYWVDDHYRRSPKNLHKRARASSQGRGQRLLAQNMPGRDVAAAWQRATSPSGRVTSVTRSESSGSGVREEREVCRRLSEERESCIKAARCADWRQGAPDGVVHVKGKGQPRPCARAARASYVLHCLIQHQVQQLVIPLKNPRHCTGHIECARHEGADVGRWRCRRETVLGLWF